MFEKFKDFIGIDENYDDYDDYDDDYEDEGEEKKSTTSSFTSSSYSNSQDDADITTDFSSSYSSSGYKSSTTSSKGGNIVNMTDTKLGGSSNLRISIQEPVDYDNDGPKIVDDILNKKVVVLNLEMVEKAVQRQILDFVSGAVYALDGKIDKVTKGIFVVTPKGVTVDNKITNEISSGNFNTL